MNIMSMFKPATPATPAATAAPVATNTPNPAGTANTPGNVANPNPAANSQNAGTGAPADPFEKFSKMWDTTTTETDAPPSFSIDPKIMTEIASKQDFMRGVDPALMQRATGGDMSAMMEIVHNATRAAYQSAIEHGGMLTDRFVGAREAHTAKGFDSRVKGQLTQGALATTPNFTNPVVRKQLKEVATRLSTQHPDASPQEIADMSRDYIQRLADAVNPVDPKANSGKSGAAVEERGEEYWDNYFNQ